MNKWVKYLLWIIGMFIIIRLGDYTTLKARMHADATMQIGPNVWMAAAVPFVYGGYLSLLFVKRRSGMNLPLFLLVFLPSMLFTLYVPVSIQMDFRIYSWVTRVVNVTGMVAGLTLIFSFFG